MVGLMSVIVFLAPPSSVLALNSSDSNCFFFVGFDYFRYTFYFESNVLISLRTGFVIHQMFFCSFLFLKFLFLCVVADEETGWYDGQVMICFVTSQSLVKKLCRRKHLCCLM